MRGYLLTILASLYSVHLCWSCDYTVRDIGFVNLQTAPLTLMVVGPDHAGNYKRQASILETWSIGFVPVRSTNIEMLPPSIVERLSTDRWTVWLVDQHRRSLLLDSAQTEEQLLPLSELLDTKFRTPRLKQLSQVTIESFAQILVFDSQHGSPESLEQAQTALAAIDDIEAMLPRPIMQPAKLISIPASERANEQLLLWSLGLEQLPADQPAIAVTYGHGRRAGPAMSSEQVSLREMVAQLALVGESCECGTDRSWIDEPYVPLEWTPEQNARAMDALGFDPTNPSVIADVKQVVARGSRTGTRQDAIEQIVTGYFEAQLGGTAPELVAIPAGKRPEPVKATVLAGEGWDFEKSTANEPIAANESLQEPKIADSQTQSGVPTTSSPRTLSPDLTSAPDVNNTKLSAASTTSLSSTQLLLGLLATLILGFASWAIYRWRSKSFSHI